jgi:chromosome partitioning protein
MASLTLKPAQSLALPPRIIVVGNEKGGAGKSTIAIHMATALMHAGAKVAVIDLDLRQLSLAHFFSHRRIWSASAGVTLPMPTQWLVEEAGDLLKMPAPDAVARFEAAGSEALQGGADFLIVDTPGADTALSRAAHANADLIVTPLNDSFVDFDMLGQVDPVTLDLIKPSLYSEVVWESRKNKMTETRRSIDWLVLRNRLATTEARNRKRLDERIQALSRRVGFRTGPGLRDRVIYRELFPFGLTVADISSTVRPIPVSLTHIAARQELRSIMSALGLGAWTGEVAPPIDAAA